MPELNFAFIILIDIHHFVCIYLKKTIHLPTINIFVF